MPADSLPAELLHWPVELLRIVPSAGSGAHLDALLGHGQTQPPKIVHLSERRVGMRVRHALMLGSKG
jgi:hypothetical protein